MNPTVGIMSAAVTLLLIAMGAFSAVARAEGGDANAANLPNAATGIWGETGCDDGSDMLLVNESDVLIARSHEDRNQIAVFPVEWAADAVIVAHPDETIVLNLAKMERCRTLPPEMYVGFGEAIALFQDMDALRAACGGELPPSACVTATFSTLDVSGDDRLSGAEITRALRAAGFFMSYAIIAESGDHSGVGMFVPTEDLYLGSALSIFVANLLATNLVQSYDYDGDGFLSLEETLQDRFRSLPDYLVEIVGNLDSVAKITDKDSLLRNFSVLEDWLQ